MEGIGEGERVLAGAARDDGRKVGRVESGFEPEQRTPVEEAVCFGKRVDSNNLGICTRSGRYNDGKR